MRSKINGINISESSPKSLEAQPNGALSSPEFASFFFPPLVSSSVRSLFSYYLFQEDHFGQFVVLLQHS